MSEEFWSSKSSSVQVMKSVVSSNGFPIGKNYEPSALRQGDLGITMKLDLGKVHNLTPDQREVAIKVAQSMSKELLAQLGYEEQETFLKPGTVVRFQTDTDEGYGYVVKETEQLVFLKLHNKHRQTFQLKRLPINMVQIEVIPDFDGEVGLLKFKFIYLNGLSEEEYRRIVAHDSDFPKFALSRMGISHCQLNWVIEDIGDKTVLQAFLDRMPNTIMDLSSNMDEIRNFEVRRLIETRIAKLNKY